MFIQQKPILTLAFACSLLLAACETPADGMKKAKHDPVSLQKPETALPVPATGNEDKIAKLEQQIADLQKEVAANRPKIAKIDVIEQKFKDLSLGLDKIDATYNVKPVAPSPVAPIAAAPVTPVAKIPEKPVTPVPVAPPKAPEKAPAKPEPKVEKPKAEPVKAEAPKPAVAGKKTVQDLRIGEKPAFSRLVLDLGQPVKITYDIDNDEKILLIDIPGFAWDAAKTKTFPKSLLIASYQVQTDDKGSHLVVQLRKAAKVANYSTIEATGGKLPRAVLDIAGQ